MPHIESLSNRTDVEKQQGLELVGLRGKKLIGIDANGTLMPDSLSTVFIPNPQELLAFHRERLRLEDDGWEIGLNSDSPYSALPRLAHVMGLSSDTPIIAEGGNVVGRGQNILLFRELADIQSVRDAIRQAALEAGYREGAEEAYSPEFGGYYPDIAGGEWSFGAGRLSSLSLFGPQELITALEGRANDIIPPGNSADFSPQYEFLGIHPGQFKQNKGETFTSLLDLGLARARQIGNSNSDCCNDPRVEIGLVGGTDRNVTPDNLSHAKFLSDPNTSHLAAVIEIMKQM